MKPTVLDRLVERLQVWPENTDYIAGHQGWLWRYQTKSGVSGGLLRPAIEAPYTDPIGRVTKEEWLRAKELAAKASAIAVAWDGEGLPPVGAETQYRIDTPRSSKWFYAKILYISAEWVIFSDDKGVEHCERVEGFVFRRYLSPAQRKEKAVQDIVTKIDECRFGTMEDYASQLYDFIAAGEISGLEAIAGDE